MAMGVNNNYNNHPIDDVLLVILLIFVLLAIVVLVGCTHKPVRLNPGECLVIIENEQIVTAGKECQIRRFNR